VTFDPGFVLVEESQACLTLVYPVEPPVDILFEKFGI